MGVLPSVSFHRSGLGGWDLLFRHHRCVQPERRRPQAVPLQLQAVDPHQGNAGGRLPAAALLLVPRAESCGSGGGAAVRGGQHDPPAQPGAPERRRVPADLQ